MQIVQVALRALVLTNYVTGLLLQYERENFAHWDTRYPVTNDTVGFGSY